MLIESPLCYCSRHYVPAKMDLPLPCLGRSNTNGCDLLGISSVTLEVSYFVEYRRREKYGIKGCCRSMSFHSVFREETFIYREAIMGQAELQPLGMELWVRRGL